MLSFYRTKLGIVMAREKIFVIAQEYPPFPPGGIANFTKYLFDNFEEYDITIFSQSTSWENSVTTEGNTTIHRRALFSNAHMRLIPVQWITFPKSIRRTFYMRLYNYHYTLRLLKKEKPTHIFCNDLESLPLAYTLFKKTKIPYSLFVHGNTLLRAMLSNKITRNFYNKPMLHAHTIWANSRYTKSKAEMYETESEVKVLPLGPCLSIETIDEAKPAPRGEKIQLLTVGRSEERKNVSLVLQALKLLNREDIQYTIVGKGPYKEEIEKQIDELELQNCVEMKGFVSDEELEEIYKRSHIFIMPSKPIPPFDIEGFGIVYLEANARGCVPIGGNSGGVPDAIEDGISGLLVDWNSPQSAAEAIEKLADNPELCSEMIKNGIDRIKDKYNWQNAANMVKADIS